MPIPDFQTVMLPLLELAADGEARPLAEYRQVLGEHFGLTEEEREELLPSGTQPVFSNRVAWASVYLQRAGLLARPKRGFYQITAEGKTVVQTKPLKIDIKFLQQYPLHLLQYTRLAHAWAPNNSAGAFVSRWSLDDSTDLPENRFLVLEPCIIFDGVPGRVWYSLRLHAVLLAASAATPVSTPESTLRTEEL